MAETAITVAGFLLACAGVWTLWGIGWALLIGGGVVFIAGGLASTRERRGP